MCEKVKKLSYEAGTYDWSDGGARLDLWAACANLPKHIKKYGEYSFMNGVVDKVDEPDDPESIPAKGTRKPCDKHTRYILSANAATRKENTRKIRELNKRKFLNDKGTFFFMTPEKGVDSWFFKECHIREHDLIERKNRDRRLGKEICRKAMETV